MDHLPLNQHAILCNFFHRQSVFVLNILLWNGQFQLLNYKWRVNCICNILRMSLLKICTFGALFTYPVCRIALKNQLIYSFYFAGCIGQSQWFIPANEAWMLWCKNTSFILWLYIEVIFQTLCTYIFTHAFSYILKYTIF